LLSVPCCHCQAVVVAGKDKGPPLKLDLDISSEELEKKLRECLASRGRKATDPKVREERRADSTTTAFQSQRLISKIVMVIVFSPPGWIWIS